MLFVSLYSGCGQGYVGMGCNTKSVKKFMENFMFLRGDRRNGKLIFLFGAISWTMWLNRNDLVFNFKIISTPGALTYKCFFFFAASGSHGERARQGGPGDAC
jgi:hypothetical protein